MNPPPLSGAPLAVVTVSTALAVFMNILDTTVANVSIPTIAGNLSVSPNTGTWVITSYAVCMAIVVPLTGWLARRFGEVRLFVGCTALFSLISAFCGFAPSFNTLVVLRALQGMVAGPMIPLSQTLLLRSYPPEKKGMALAFWGMTSVLAPIVGPTLGGYVTDNFGWPWIFYINAPVGVASAYVTWSVLKDRESPITRAPIDAVGLALLVVGVGALQVALDQGRENDWLESSFIVALLVVAFMALPFFLVWERDEPNPVVDLTLFRSRNFTMASLAIALGYGSFFAGIVVFPLWLQTQMGYTATWAGLASSTLGILTLILTPIVGSQMHRTDLRYLATFAFIVFAVTCFWQAQFTTQVSFWDVTTPRFVQGIAMAFFFVPLTTISLAGLPPDRYASAAGVTNFMRMLTGAFAASLSVTIWDRRNYQHQSHLLENLNPFNPQAWGTVAAIEDSGSSQEAALRMLAREVSRQAVTLATDDIFWLSGWIFASLIVLVWLTRGPFMTAQR
ncbi:MAG: DHA2 family efflux MFS transporter permease subunit [Nitrospinae bacterium]|nr:DHA2 family efflux MFS transporter permease subunit [Nitrospinota bacterium]